MFNVQMRNYRGSHIYSWEQHQDIPSVSRIIKVIDDGLSDRLMNWKAKVVGEKVKEAILSASDRSGLFQVYQLDEIIRVAKKRDKSAAEAGSAVHESIENAFTGRRLFCRASSLYPSGTE